MIYRATLPVAATAASCASGAEIAGADFAPVAAIYGPGDVAEGTIAAAGCVLGAILETFAPGALDGGG